MNPHMRALVAIAAIMTLETFGGSEPLTAQTTDATPIFLAVPRTFPDIEARAVVMREPGRDMVILREEDAEPETLRVALSVLYRMRRVHPRPADRGQVIPITGYAWRGSMRPALRQRMERAFSELEGRPLADVGNLGVGRWIRLRLE